MKKIIRIIAVLTILAFSVETQAKYSDYFRVYHDGIELVPGDTVYCSNYQEIVFQNIVKFHYEGSVNVVNQLDESNINWAKLTYSDCPTEEQSNSDKEFWGNLALCYYGGDENGEMASCMSPTGSAVRIPNNEYDCFEWHPQLQNASPQCRSAYTLILKAAFGELAWSNYTFAEDSEFSITIIFAPKETAKIDALPMDNSQPVYYDLNGRSVDNPRKGLYIVKRGNSYSKEYIIGK